MMPIRVMERGRNTLNPVLDSWVSTLTFVRLLTCLEIEEVIPANELK